MVFAYDDLVDAVRPGDRVEVMGARFWEKRTVVPFEEHSIEDI